MIPEEMISRFILLESLIRLMTIEISPTAGVDELRKMLQLLSNYLVDGGLKEGKLSESTARTIVRDEMVK
jgi:hypothetical protein